MRNAVAVIEGLIEEGGHFKRNPKSCDGVGQLPVRRVPGPSWRSRSSSPGGGLLRRGGQWTRFVLALFLPDTP